MNEIQIISRIRQKGLTGSEWGAGITREVIKLWMIGMSLEDLAFLFQGKPQCLLFMSPSALAQLDQIIIRQARTCGWRIRLSEWVQARLSMWDSELDGPKRFQQLGAAEARAALVFQRRGRKPSSRNPDLYLFRKDCIKELRTLLHKMKGFFELCNRKSLNQAEDDLVAYFLEAVAKKRRTYPAIARNLDRWQPFFEKEENRLALRNAVRNGRVFPEALFDKWLGWCKGMDPKSLSESISRLGRSPLVAHSA